MIVRFLDRETGDLAAGVLVGDGQAVPVAPDVAHLLALGREDVRARVERARATGTARPVMRLLTPVDGRTEIWASGVTYRRSREAREEESREASVYARVYDAPRPELFLKAPAWRAVTDGDPIAVRADSAQDVPEPELAVVANADGELVGLTVADDVSSRAIEGENPLYLPQAKCYAGSCALGCGIRPIWEVDDPHALAIHVEVHRADAVAWRDETSTAQLHRRIEDLVGALFAEQEFPAGAVLLTGTGVVPDMDFTLQAGDEVRIEIAGVGTLCNPVVRGKRAWRAAMGASAVLAPA